MSYSVFPATEKVVAPTVTDDSSKGYVVGSQVVNTAVTPRTLYTCTDNSVGAAVWLQLGAASLVIYNSGVVNDFIAVSSFFLPGAGTAWA